MKQPVGVIAEIANAHQGDVETAIALARAAAGAGADAVKFQIYFAHELLVADHPRFQHFLKQSFSSEQWQYLFDSLQDLPCPVFADVLGEEALAVALRHDVQGLKVHSSDLTNVRLLDALSYSEQTILLATGGGTIVEVHYAIERLMRYDKPSGIVLMHGFQAYPTAVEDAALHRLGEMRDLFGDKVTLGYMDHIDAEDEMAVIVPLLALPFGVRYLEKHITFDRWKKGVDYYSSFEPDEFRSFVDLVRKAEKALGEQRWQMSEAERHYRHTVRKSWTAVTAIAAGETLKTEHLLMRRAESDAGSPFLEDLAGAVTKRTLRSGEVVRRSDVHHKVLAVVVARVGSSRLPGKALLEINGRPALAHLFERVLIAKQRGIVDTIAFCTTTSADETPLLDVAMPYPVKIYRGSRDDVLGRMLLAVNDHRDHDIVLRITGDDLLVDPDYMQRAVKQHLEQNADYTDVKQLPSGTEVEVFDSHVLRLIHGLSRNTAGSEYLTNYIKDNAAQFNTASTPVDARHRRALRLTLDTYEDYEVIRGLLEHMKHIGREFDYTLDDIVAYFDEHPERASINRHVKQRSAPVAVETALEWQSLTREPLVTVFITNHNYGRFLEKSIESVLGQKFRDFELIIIDDGSTDHSRELIAKYAGHPKVRTVFQENKGLNVSNNIALKLARGKYLMRLDADDYLDDNALLVMVNILEEDPGLALVYPDYYLVDEHDNVLTVERRHDSRAVELPDQACHGACTMIRKSVLNDMRGYSEEFSCQDGYELWLKTIERYRFDNVNLPLFYYRQHDRSLTANETRILETRSNIVAKYAGKRKVQEKNHVCIIPIRNDNAEEPLALRKFADKTLLDCTIDSLVSSVNVKHVIVSSPDERIVEYVTKSYGKRVVADRRPPRLAALNSHIEETVRYLIDKYRKVVGEPDSITVVNYEFPFRKASDIDKAINTLYLFDADSVVSVTRRNANFYHHHGSGLVPFRSNTDLSLERDFVYEESGGIHGVKYAAFEQHGRLVCGRTTHILLDELSARIIASELDLELSIFLYERLRAQQPVLQ